jgi:hypothetical protein
MTIGHLRTCQLDPASAACRLGSRLQRHVRPQAWQDLLSRSDPALLPEPDWWLPGCGGFVREGRNGPAFVVRADGRLDQPPPGGAPHLAPWQPAAVCWCPVLKGQELLASLPPPAYLQPPEEGQDQCQLQPYLLGPWTGAVVDPSLWQIGQLLAVSHFTVCHASLRLRLLRRRGEQDATFNVASGHRPRLWAAGYRWQGWSGGC